MTSSWTHAVDFAQIPRFVPASVNGVPLDVRTAFDLTLHIR